MTHLHYDLDLKNQVHTLFAMVDNASVQNFLRLNYDLSAFALCHLSKILAYDLVNIEVNISGWGSFKIMASYLVNMENNVILFMAGRLLFIMHLAINTVGFSIQINFI